MSRTQLKDLKKKEREEMITNLFDVVMDQRTQSESVSFLILLLSPGEIIMIARRLQIAQLLLEEKSYRYISKELGVSESTVSAIALRLSDDEKLKRQIGEHKKKREKKSRQKYKKNILNPYIQLQVIKDILDI